MKNRSKRKSTHHHPVSEFRLPVARVGRPGFAPGLEIRPSPLHGLGCFATQFFPRGRKVAEYEGERVLFARLTDEQASWDLNYIIGIDDEWAIDGGRGGNQTRYINHSCEPNVFIRTLYGHVIFYALRDIQPGEEIVWDYVITDGYGRIDPCPCEKAAAPGQEAGTEASAAR